jgi:hypothetical protein
MLIKEDNMRRLLFVGVLLVLLFGTFSTAIAQEPPAQLGEVWWFLGPGFAPGEEVNMYLYRPPTVDALGVPTWPFAGGPWWGTWYWPGGDSADRRQSWPAWQNADAFGVYYAEFMLPRDEVWYPCSYPYKWNCNYVLYPGDPINPPIVEYHSPAWQGNFELGLEWPHFDAYTYFVMGDWLGALAMANPMDTVSPLTAKMLNTAGAGYFFDFEVDGYYWKWSDLEEPFYWIGWP